MDVIQYLTDQVMRSPDSVEMGYRGPGWYFWDESWANCHGPFVDSAQAAHEAAKYGRRMEVG